MDELTDEELGVGAAPARPAAPRGVYLHGSVGTGKTLLMDLLYGCCDAPHRRRVHIQASPTGTAFPSVGVGGDSLRSAPGAARRILRIVAA